MTRMRTVAALKAATKQPRMSMPMMLLLCLCLIGLPPAVVSARAILGVDLGSLYMKVALVQSGSPLEIVTNLHSQRKTEQMILLEKGTQQRFYGADAASFLAKKSNLIPSAMSLMLGRDDQHPTVQVLAERHYPLLPVYNESVSGVTLTVDGHAFTPAELVAMVLTHAVDISVAYQAASGSGAVPTPKDVVLTVPTFATQHERRGLLDAAALADLNVLALIEENTAAALQYAMDNKNFQEKPELILFYNMGASALQVTLVRFFTYEQPNSASKLSKTPPKHVPAMEVLSKAWDFTAGGMAVDHLLVEYLADQFNHAWQRAKHNDTLDVRKVPRAISKLQIQANKVKHVLSANADFPIFMESVHDDIPLNTHITRETLEGLLEQSGLLERAVAPVLAALKAANVSASNLTAVELLGGGMRIPRIQAELQKALGDSVELGMHINSDESMALGAAFAGANISTAFRVRPIGMTDITPFSIGVTLSNLPDEDEEEEQGKGGLSSLFGVGGGKKRKLATATADSAATTGETDADDTKDDNWSKQATIFKARGKMGVKKTIAFSHDRNVHCALDYTDDGEDSMLPPGTEKALERYNITGVTQFAKEMQEKGLGKPKISLQFEMTPSGITSLVRAEAAVEETYTVEEEVPVDDDINATSATNETNATAEERKLQDNDNPKDDAVNETATTDTDAANKTNATTGAKKAPVKPKKTIKVQKEKKRLLKRPLTITTYHVGRVRPHTPELLNASKAKLLAMAERDKERMMIGEAKNDIEAYMYRIKNKLVDEEEAINKVTTEEQREAVLKAAEAAEDWLMDEADNADYKTLQAKLSELKTPFEKIMLRVSETTARPEAVKALEQRLKDIEALLSKWETTMPQVTEAERTEVLEKVEEVRKWMAEKELEQAAKLPHEEPAFFSFDLPEKTFRVETMMVKLSRKPKPKPKVEKKKKDEKNGTKSENATSATSDSNTTTSTTADADPVNATTTAAGDDETKDQGDSTKTATGESDEKPTEGASNESVKGEDEL